MSTMIQRLGKRLCHIALLLLCLGMGAFNAPALASDQQPSVHPLERILQQVKQGSAEEQRLAQAKVDDFTADLTRLEQQLSRAEARLKASQDANTVAEDNLLDLQNKLRRRQQLWTEESKSLEALFTTVTEHTQLLLDRVVDTGLWAFDSTELQIIRPQDVDIEQVNRLWQALLEQTVLSGRIINQQQDVILPDGSRAADRLTQFGPFNAHSEQGWLSYIPSEQSWGVMSVQPEVQMPDEGMIIDPAFGELLKQNALAPNPWQRLKPAGIVGALIGLVGLVGLLVSAVRSYALYREKQQVNWQIQQEKAQDNNSLGRIILAVETAQMAETQGATVEAIIDEAVLKEVPTLRKGIGSLAVLTGIPPLLGLLGTVAGMIETFRIITEHGNADSQLLSGGIAQALLTTELGLIVAVPLLLLHCAVKSQSTHLIELLEQQGAGLIVARHTGWGRE